MNDWITAQQAATELGVSSSTLKRFCDRHEIPITRTPGGHRRIDRFHLALASHMMRGRPTQSHSTQRLDRETTLRLLRAADHIQLTELFWSESICFAGLIKLLDDVLVPTLWHLGDLRSKHHIETAEEAVCTATAAATLDGIFSRMPAAPPSAPIYLAATLPPSLDTLAEKFIAIALRSIGIKPLNLGCNVLPETIANVVKLVGAAAVCISHTHITDIVQTLELHQTLASLIPPDCRIIIGGGDLTPRLRQRLSHCVYYESIPLMIAHEVEYQKGVELLP